ncbi:hypothetical protein [Gorillibacterium sp. sgz5001074]|uniref:hypothetical protein n=1 Tax=Gorillibacterium sp. sgz5001074 TaxID=3446695 RepID=UPI003F67C400
MNKMKKIALIGVVCLASISGGVLIFAKGESPWVTPQRKISSEEFQQLKLSTELIINEFGEFKRTLNAPEVQPSEVAHDEKAINQHTKLLVTDYGVFVKQE